MNTAFMGIAVMLVLGFIMFSLTDSLSFAQTSQDTSSVTCREGFVILTKQDGATACVSPSTYLRLVDRGWGVWNDSVMASHPMMANKIMNQMEQNPHIMQHWHNMMMQNQQYMQEVRSQWIEKLKENPQLLANMMGPITTDPELRQKMIDQMEQNQEMMMQFRNDTQGASMMQGSMMMGQGMHGSGMGMQGCTWCSAASTSEIQYGTATCPWCPVTNQTMGMGWMMHNPQNIEDMMHHVWLNSELRQQMFDMMIQNPWHMGQMMNQTMGSMMGPMMNDPQLRQEMLDMMEQNQDFMQQVREEAP